MNRHAVHNFYNAARFTCRKARTVSSSGINAGIRRQGQRCMYHERVDIYLEKFKGQQKKRNQIVFEDDRLDNTRAKKANPREQHQGSFLGSKKTLHKETCRRTETMPRFIPFGTDLHKALTTMPETRRGIRFNPWILLLELLYDPRISWAFDPHRLFTAMSHLRWITQDNLFSQRTLFANYMFTSRCVASMPQFSVTLADRVLSGEEALPLGGVDLSPAQSMVFSQMQWPRFITRKLVKTNTINWELSTQKASRLRMAKLECQWLATNLSVLEYTVSRSRSRTAFARELGKTERAQILLRSAFNSSPGLVLNTIMSVGGNYSKTFNSYTVARVMQEHFSDVATATRAVCGAWWLYDFVRAREQDRLLHNRSTSIRHTTGIDSFNAGRSTADRSMKQFDVVETLMKMEHWDEATNSLGRLYQQKNKDNIDNAASEVGDGKLPKRLQPEYLAQLLDSDTYAPLVRRYLKLYSNRNSMRIPQQKSK